jgi:hypothetical protein
MGRGLSELQKEILTLISGNGYVAVRSLYEHFGSVRDSKLATTRAVVCRAISRLQNRGLLERVSLIEGRRKAPAVLFSRKKLADRLLEKNFSKTARRNT